MIVKHSKYKNTGILFELLVRQITSDTLSGVDSKAATILKKHFVKTELGKEYKLYETLLNNIKLSEGKADIIINTLLESAKYLNKSALRRQKYNLIKEIKANYDVDEFFKTKLPNYKT
jgi:DNA-binding sugar fermentation-stimulating protein